ncbi:developmental pluripotency associated 2 L homeolog isoform X2 [Xenopus laevis]|uniref:Developmental pluripotency associated 2 L homeolog isoform X2 n=1 Tax=Xenopus laevis TaxID=8355 RepID=A0A8J0U5U9_XENLA|nr:developmental pluripotency associated 2 L homeolog isoform X2 [Xenopus laevis]
MYLLESSLDPSGHNNPGVSSAANMPKRRAKTPAPEPDLTPNSLQLLKRAQLQQHCKRLGLRGTGKNAELVQRLQEYFQQAAANEQEDPTTPSLDENEKESEVTGRGWCVVHGQEMTVSSWKPLFLRCGRVCVTCEGSCVPLHLTPSSSPTPCGLQDNLICDECFERNQERECRLQQRSVFQDNYPPMGQMRKSVSTTRTRKKSGRFQPQEDPEYARRVDELLDQLATGQVDSQKILKPSRPAVLHSPLPKPESSPIAINQ